MNDASMDIVEALHKMLERGLLKRGQHNAAPPRITLKPTVHDICPLQHVIDDNSGVLFNFHSEETHQR